MKGSSTSAALRVSATFATAFAVGAITIFSVVALAGAVVRVDEIPLPWRLGISGLGFVAFAVVDFVAIRKRSYCLVSWRRQTPQWLRFRYGVAATVAIWGFDTGLTVTTFRVAALTWAALLLTFLRLTSWQIGFAYALAFVIPIIAILNSRPTTNPSSGSLEALLCKRVVLQGISVTILIVTGTLILVLRS